MLKQYSSKLKLSPVHGNMDRILLQMNMMTNKLRNFIYRYEDISRFRRTGFDRARISLKLSNSINFLFGYKIALLRLVFSRANGIDC